MKEILETRLNHEPKNIDHELMLAERAIRRADRQKLHQPLNKRMTADQYAIWLQSRKPS